jgi:hypothetical protein
MTRGRSGPALGVLTVLLAVTAVLPASAASAAPAPPAALVRHGAVVAQVLGSTHVLLGPATFGVTVQQDPLAYEALLFADGTVQGVWRYDYYEAGVLTRFSGRVTCLAVQGDRAWVGGVIDSTTDPTSAGLGAWWQVADLGSGAHPVIPDRTTFAGIGTLQATQAYCDNRPDPHFIFDVQSGGVVVIDRQPPPG